MSALLAESWTWYGLTWMVVVVRMISRRLVVGSVRKFQLDDYIMMFAMITDTVLIASMNIIAVTSSNLIDPSQEVILTPDSIKEREFGSKMVLVVEQMQILTIWAVKACLLLLYNRLTMSLRQNIAVKAVAVYVAVSFVVMEILYLGVWCRPFNQYWAVPPDNVQCSAATNHLITNMVLNISSDIMIILIPMPVFLQSKIAPKKKLILCGVFAVGCFTILSAILNKYYSFTDPFGADWTFWYIRESSTALITANLPMTWTLCRRVFSLTSFHEKSSYPRTGSAAFTNRFRSNYGRGTTVSAADNRPDAHELSRAGSQEHINREYADIPLKIYQHHEIEISTHRIDRDEEAGGAGLSDDRRNSPDGRRGVGSTTKVTSGGAMSEESASERSSPGVIKVASGV
ncbi:hypothetical protein F5X68DRAFT_40837 [Plectosphaerella plurivora]|uniref:Rhodopsin domain-containing protein n=1 Tax=Plectosphaerella plurivora TaxID=936078 RepID=A0A9P9A739_9PEZI|nr:hypothetical protein F5X68DRAFT_40837 [Plectosphaerella plurivora]